MSLPVPLSVAEQIAWIEGWRAWMRSEADRLVELACQTGLYGGEQWDTLLTRWGVTPLPHDERMRHATSGPPRTSGPPPIELRLAGEAVAAYTKEQLVAFDRAHNPPIDVDRQLDKLRYEANDLAKHMLDRYLNLIRPKPTTTSIFANARASMPRAAAVGPGLSTLACPSCGAPRRGAATTRTCEFCGSTL